MSYHSLRFDYDWPGLFLSIILNISNWFETINGWHVTWLCYQMLVNDVNLEICAAYGSSKDISVYSNVGLKPDSIFIVGKISRKQQGQAQSLIEGNIPSIDQFSTVHSISFIVPFNFAKNLIENSLSIWKGIESMLLFSLIKTIAFHHHFWFSSIIRCIQNSASPEIRRWVSETSNFNFNQMQLW